jgi:hypothetical protein
MTAGYSGTPLAKKLGIKPGQTLAAIDAPDNYEKLLDPLPEDVRISHSAVPNSDVIHFFTNSRVDLFQGLTKYRNSIKQDGIIWISWFKKSAKLPTEITEDVVREAALQLGLVDVKVCAVDEKWSGLKLVIRRENRL